MTVTIPDKLTGIEREGVAAILEAVERFGPDVEAYQQLGGIRAVLSPGGGLLLFNYSIAAEIEQGWTPVERVSRGLIIDWRTCTVRAMPFSKFFNLNEMPETEYHNLPVGPYDITDKLDGSMGIGYYDEEGYYRIATRGSFTSEQAQWATRWWHEQYDDFVPSYVGAIIAPEASVIFEIIYPENKIVLQYPPEMTGLHLIGLRYTDGREAPRRELEHLGEFLDLPVARAFYGYHIDDLIELLPNLKGVEGFVVRFHETGLRVKFKTDEYKNLHRLLSLMSYNRLLEIAHKEGETEMMRYVTQIWDEHSDNATVLDLSQQYANAILEAVDAREKHLRALYAGITDNGRLCHVLDRKKLSQVFRERCDENEFHFMFSIMAGNDIRPTIIKHFWLNRNNLDL